MFYYSMSHFSSSHIYDYFVFLCVYCFAFYTSIGILAGSGEVVHVFFVPCTLATGSSIYVHIYCADCNVWMSKARPRKLFDVRRHSRQLLYFRAIDNVRIPTVR
jgi:hypothetical protein